MNEKRPIAIDLFSGAGGMTLGFEQAGFDVLASVEIDPIHCATHHYNFPLGTIICKSITDISGEEIRQLSAIKEQGTCYAEQEIDVVFGGPPCQGFSLIGKRLLDDPRNSLVFHFLRLITELKPKYFVMENVFGMTVGKHKHFLKEVIDEFSRQNYSVEENYQVLNAANYGVPQNRKRLFLFGCRKDCQLPKYPQFITSPQGKNHLSKTPTVFSALQDLPVVENYPELETQDWVIAEYKKPSDYASKLRDLALAKDDYSYNRQYNLNLLTSSRRTKHNPESIERFAATECGKTEPISRFYKLSPEGLCNTLRAGTPTQKGAYTAPRPIHYAVPRCITVREAARLHSYPDWFRFHGTKWHGFRQIGNSVPPLLAKAVAQEILQALNITPQKPSEIIQLGEEKLLNFNPSQAAEYYSIDPQIMGSRLRKTHLKLHLPQLAQNVSK